MLWFSDWYDGPVTGLAVHDRHEDCSSWSPDALRERWLPEFDEVYMNAPAIGWFRADT